MLEGQCMCGLRGRFGRQERGKGTNTYVLGLKHFNSALKKIILQETKAQTFSDLLEIIRWD